MNKPTGPAHGLAGMKQRYRIIYESEAVATSPEEAARMIRHMLQVSKTELPLQVQNISTNTPPVEIMTGLQPLVTSENFGKLLLESAQQAARHSNIEQLITELAAVEPVLKTELHGELLAFLQAEYDAAGTVRTVSGEEAQCEKCGKILPDRGCLSLHRALKCKEMPGRFELDRGCPSEQ